MLVLCSDGLTSEAVRAALRLYTDGMKTAALVVTADNEYKEKNYHVPRCREELRALGLAVDLLDIDETPCEALKAYDLAEFIGGNPYYLLASIRRQGGEPVLRRLAASKILIGWSAAAFVFGPSLAPQQYPAHQRRHPHRQPSPPRRLRRLYPCQRYRHAHDLHSD